MATRAAATTMVRSFNPVRFPRHLYSTKSISSPGRTRRFIVTSSLVAGCFLAGFAMAASPAAQTVDSFIHPPSDADTLKLYHPDTVDAEEIDTKIRTHPLAEQLRAKEGISEWRPHCRMPVSMRSHNLTAGTLVGPEKLAVPPLAFSDRNSALPSVVQIAFLGPALCGHPGIIHGGLLATMLDEGLAWACFPALPHKVGVTASLKVDYLAPCPANSYVVLRARTTKVEGRKAWVEGWIELLGEGTEEGKKLVHAEALYIEPRGAQHMARVYGTPAGSPVPTTA
ncbi:hypothetical protein K470DRAFT_255659 [Piedraia hortae CBS 480.64]|uniref:Thioesterase domain-containing protein n=1 Tax=Piedraia hortae CBS 480.64 TaxID=1314780 RepID=A0A6A7C679_9PEZI|nr:hypothetical protein K470DRAFT_255659 [Piedraia hortae CBS 480.64]